MENNTVLNSRLMAHQDMLDYWQARKKELDAAIRHRPTRFERYTQEGTRAQTRGDVLLQRLYDVFNHGLGKGRRWSQTQQMIFKAFVDTALPKIYGAEWEEVKVRVMRERQLEKEQPWALVNMARRNGKTFVTAGTAAAFILAIPNLSIAIFSTGIRASQMLRDTLNDMIESAFEAGTHVRREAFRVIQKNKETYVMEHPEGGKQVIGCYPGSVRTTRGTGADIIIVDEAAHVDPDLFYKVIVPILQLKNTCLLALSSPEGDSNYYSELMNLKDDTTGERMFKLVDCVMVCADCKKKDRAEWLHCNHVQQSAFWLDSRKTHRIKMLYKTNPALAAREIQGMIVSDYRPCFQKEDVERMFSNSLARCLSVPKYVFTSADPNGGGPSHMAMCSAYYDQHGNFVVVGLESEPVKHESEQYFLLRRHYERLRSVPKIGDAQFVFIPENNLGLEASHLDTMVRNLTSVQTYWEKDKPGVCKTQSKTRDYQFLTTTALQSGMVVFSDACFTTSRNQTTQTIKSMLMDQMLRYHWEKRPASDAFSNDRWTQTGKMGDKQDDLYVAFAMTLYWGRAVINDPRRLARL